MWWLNPLYHTQWAQELNNPWTCLSACISNIIYKAEPSNKKDYSCCTETWNDFSIEPWDTNRPWGSKIYLLTWGLMLGLHASTQKVRKVVLFSITFSPTLLTSWFQPGVRHPLTRRVASQVPILTNSSLPLAEFFLMKHKGVEFLGAPWNTTWWFQWY